MRIERWFEMPRSYTFEMPKLRAWVEARLVGRTLNLFGGKVRLSGPDVVTHNDIDTAFMPDATVDAYDPDAVSELGKFDTVVLDPPYSAYQAVKTYKCKKFQQITLARKGVEHVISPTGYVISLGFNSTGMGMHRGYRKLELAIINQGGSHNDILCLLEQRECPE